MKMSEKELLKISERLINLAAELHFMYDAAKLASRIVGCYCDSSYEVITHLQDVLRRADNLRNDLCLVSASLDDLLVKNKPLDDVEVSDV